MKPPIQAVFAILFCGAFVGPTNAQVRPDQPPKTVRIRGRIIDNSSAPIRNQTIKLEVNGKEEISTAQTDVDGSFIFPGVKANQHYNLVIVVPGFVPWSPGFDVAEIDLDLGNYVLQRPRPIRISGRLIRWTGEHIPDQTVDLEVTGRGQKIAARTDENGHFALSDLPPKERCLLKVAMTGISD